MATLNSSRENPKIEPVTTRVMIVAWLWAAVIFYFALRAALG